MSNPFHLRINDFQANRFRELAIYLQVSNDDVQAGKKGMLVYALWSCDANSTN